MSRAAGFLGSFSLFALTICLLPFSRIRVRRNLRENDDKIQRARAATTVAVEREDDAGALAGRGTGFFSTPTRSETEHDAGASAGRGTGVSLTPMRWTDATTSPTPWAAKRTPE